MEEEILTSIPHFFKAHAHSAFENNTILLYRESDLEEIEISSQNTFHGFSYHGKWSYQYNIGNLTVTDEATIASTFDSSSGILLRMEIEMISTQESTGPISQEINVDAVGSFKISLVLYSNYSSDYSPFFLVAFTLIIGNRKLRKIS